MKKYLLGLLLLGGAMFSSCMTDDDSKTQLSDKCYISSFALQSVKQVRHTLSSTGKDSIYTVKIDGSYFPMTIDHRTLVIENRDSLPYGSQVNALNVTVAYNGLVLSHRAVDEKSDSAWRAYSAKDSVNFSKPRHFSVMAFDQKVSRLYTVKVNVHQQEGDSLYWHRSDSVVPALESMTAMKAVALNGQLLVLGHTPAGLQTAIRSGLAMSGTWTIQPTMIPDDADLNTLQHRESELFLSTRSGQILTSKNGVVWDAVGEAQDGLRLVAVTEQYFYAYVDGALCHSVDAMTWQEEGLDEDASLLPQQNMQSVSYTQSNGNNRLFLSGVARDEAKAKSASWSKMWRYDAVEGDVMWMYYTLSPDNRYPFPILQDQSLFSYDGKLVTFGGKPLQGDGKAMDCFYVSRDNGITWKADVNIHLPRELEGVAGPLAATVDANHYIWIIANKQVWRGRLNRLGFERP